MWCETRPEGSPEADHQAAAKMTSVDFNPGPCARWGQWESSRVGAAEVSFVEGQGGGLEMEERAGGKEPTTGMRSHRQEET